MPPADAPITTISRCIRALPELLWATRWREKSSRGGCVYSVSDGPVGHCCLPPSNVNKVNGGRRARLAGASGVGRAKKASQSADREHAGKPPKVVIAGVGASAGGVRALQILFNALPSDTGIAFVVVVHL